MADWQPMWKAMEDPRYEDPNVDSPLRRVIMAGYYYESGQKYPSVGEAYWGSPDGRAQRWIWRDGGDVVDVLGYMDLPDFPIASKNDMYVVGRFLDLVG